MKGAVSHLSVSAEVSIAKVDLVTRLSLVEFQAIGAELKICCIKILCILPD